ncbi:MAG TPA: hypothetical protein VMG31_05830 [Verrucomicrobiae bacterium]|nr:hypothetical protein [Verrucomicrobiae bacterium]
MSEPNELQQRKRNEQECEKVKLALRTEPMKCSPKALAYLHELLVRQEKQRQARLNRLIEKFEDDINNDPFDEGLTFTVEEWNFVREQLAHDLRESEKIVWEVEAYRKAVQE